MMHLVGNLVGLLDACNEKRAIVIGHDFGASVAWAATMMRPDIFPAMAALSIPFRQRAAPPLEMRRSQSPGMHYWIYFQEEGVAENEFERDIRATYLRLFGDGRAPLPQAEAPS